MFGVNQQENEKMDIFSEEMEAVIHEKLCGQECVQGMRRNVEPTAQEIAEILIDIHGQHEHQSLLQKKKHRMILDDYAGTALGALKSKLREKFHSYQQIKKEIRETGSDATARGKEVSLLQFEVTEIEEAAPVEGEDEELEARYLKMTNSRRIK